MFQIFVQHESTITVDVYSKTPIASVKGMVKEKTRYPATAFYLVYEGKVLENKCTLFDYGVNNLSTLQLRFRHSSSSSELLWEAVAKDQLDQVKVLLSHLETNVNWSNIDKEGKTALMEAVRRRNVTITRRILDHPALELNCKSTSGRTALHWAVVEKTNAEDFELLGRQEDTPHIIQLLLSQGADETIADNHGRTAIDLARLMHVSILPFQDKMLFTAAAEGSTTALQKARQLMASKADVNWTNVRDGKTALIEAASRGQVSMAELLLSNGADVNRQSSNGYTALHWATMKKHANMLRLLTRKGIDMSVKDAGGRTAMDLARLNQFHECIAALQELGGVFPWCVQTLHALRKQSSLGNPAVAAPAFPFNISSRSPHAIPKKVTPLRDPLNVRLRRTQTRQYEIISMTDSAPASSFPCFPHDFEFNTVHTLLQRLRHALPPVLPDPQVLQAHELKLTRIRQSLCLSVGWSPPWSAAYQAEFSDTLKERQRARKDWVAAAEKLLKDAACAERIAQEKQEQEKAPKQKVGPTEPPEKKQRVVVKGLACYQQLCAALKQEVAALVSSMPSVPASSSLSLSNSDLIPLYVSSATSSVLSSSSNSPSSSSSGNNSTSSSSNSCILENQLAQALQAHKDWLELSSRKRAASTTNQAVSAVISELKATIISLEGVLVGESNSITAGSAAKMSSDRYVASLAQLSERLRAEQALQEKLAREYPLDLVFKFLRMVEPCLEASLAQAQLLDNLCFRLQSQLQEQALAGQLEQDMRRAHQTYEDAIRANKKSMIDNTYTLAHAKLDQQAEDSPGEKTHVKVEKLVHERKALELSKAKLCEQHHKIWRGLVDRAQLFRPEMLVRGWWLYQAGTGSDCPRWAEALLSFHSTGGLDRTDLRFEKFTDHQLISSANSRHAVHRVVDPLTQSFVVLKRYMASDLELRTIRKEARLLHDLGKHPYVASVHHTFGNSLRQELFLQMPYYDGGTLAEWLREPRSEEHRRVVLRQLLLALQHVHSRGVIHCDVKPENVFMASVDPPHVKLGDFDVSKDTNLRTKHAGTLAFTMMMTAVGVTPLYAAPELISPRNKPATYASDMYALGLICYEMWWPTAERQPGKPPDFALLPTTEQTPALKGLITLLHRWLHDDPAQRPLPSEVLADSFFSEAGLRLENRIQVLTADLLLKRGPPRSCRVCFDDKFLSDGLDCASGHFLCDDCFAGLVESQVTQEGFGKFRERKGQIFCPAICPAECKSAYSEDQLAAHGRKVFPAYVQMLIKLREQELSVAMEQQMKSRIEKEVKRLQRTSHLELLVQQAKLHVEDEILTLKCPRPECKQAFLDFNGCFALTCGSCQCGFCAWCLKDCGQDAHQHVPLCASNLEPRKQVFASLDLFRQAHRNRRHATLVEYLCSLGDEGLVRAVVQSLHVSLRDVGLLDSIQTIFN
eukprot:gb/GEZN01000409.1/.p1 GENE.gb/GEZN01000409.1/~~gb/GEZN01000409.1/.p1  ORF type:complete len:1427 (-),score=209.47 gb/GEZN01000409.1/:191-4471(-)